MLSNIYRYYISCCLYGIHFVFAAGESRLITSSTPQILSSEEAAAVSNTHFWLSWQVDTGHVRCIRLLDTSNTGGERSIINWPIPVTFTPRRISTLAQPHVHLR